MFACCCTAGTQTGFHSGSTAVVKLEAFQVAGESGSHFFQKFHLDLCGEVMAVHDLVGILGNTFSDFGVAMSQCGHIDTAGKVDVLIAIGVFHHAALSFFKGDGEQSYLTGKTAVIFFRTGMEFFTAGAGDLACDKTGDLCKVKLIGSRIVLSHNFFLSFGVVTVLLLC